MFIIHIGKHKTGSSSIQQFLATNADKLQQFDIIYPQIARQKKAHHNLVRQLKGDRRFGPVLGGWDEIRALAEKKDSRIVLSSEGFETLKEQQIRELKQRVGGVETTIVVYIRRLSSLLPSRYNQLTKKGINTDDFDQFYSLYGPPSGFNLMHRIQRWGDEFGWENVRIRLLDARHLTGGTLIDDFLSVLGVSLADVGGPGAKELFQNVSLGWKPIEVLRALFSCLRQYVDSDPDNPSRIRRDTASLVRAVCLETLSALKLDTERTPYLSAGQYKECDDVWATELGKLNEVIVGPKLPLPDAARPPVERPFFPTIQRIPREERAEIAARISAELRIDSVEDRSDKDPRAGRRGEKLIRCGLGEDLRARLVKSIQLESIPDEHAAR